MSSTLVSAPPAKKASVTHANNFHFLRLLFATFVIITHSYALLGLPEEDVLYQLTGGQVSFTFLAVPGFMVLSGLLITKSMMRSNSLVDYFYKRALRIFPGLWTVLMIMAGVCFFVSNKSAVQYFSHYTVRDYVFFSGLLRMQYEIDGVFKQLPWHLINGSLWTIPVEVFMYIVLASTWYIRKNTRAMLVVMVLAFVGLLAARFLLYANANPATEAGLGFWLLKPSQVVHLALYFVGGAIWALLPLPTERRRNLLAGSAFVVFFGLVLSLPHMAWTSYFLFPLILVPLGSLAYPGISALPRFGDISYGVYLWGWPVQQLLIYYFHPSYLQLVIFSIIGAYIMGYLSWKLVEERALRLKLRLPDAPAGPL
ncbi:acyltransferase family protein [Hymenobacter pini]|uniref:acyltransferase family protein n=1 Tax=Hymenobacter pini TaxID=2880879 RepID=UPI001CF31726|nr:acyltransferase [Hymenobacter pini]MCA8833427.1 acyltransferase [Hymenobacter pini]